MALLGTDDERRLLAVIEADASWEAHRDALVVQLLLATGLRISSVVALDAADVDLDRGWISAPANGGRRLTVSVPAAQLIEHVGGAGPLFCSRSGRRLTVRQVQLRFAGWVKAAKVRSGVTPHGLRHTFGTRLYAETKDLRRVQVALGHRSVGTTERCVGVGRRRPMSDRRIMGSADECR